MDFKKINLQLTSILMILALFSSGCQSKPKNIAVGESQTREEEQNSGKKANEFFTIDFAEIIKNKRDVPLSEIAESIEIIPLENNEKSLIGRIMNVRLTKDYIFVKHNGDKRLTQFNRQGKFIRHFGTLGRGPKEYALMRIFSLDEENELVYIHTNWTRKILVYNFDGEYVKTIKFNTIGRGQISWSRDSLLVSFSEPQVGNEKFVFIEQNQNGDTLQATNNNIFWEENEKSQFMVSYWGRDEFYRFGNKLHMKGWYNDTVYSYNEQNKIVPKFFIDLKEHKIPDDLVFERKSTKSMPTNCYWVGVNESSNYVFIRYGAQYNKRDKLQENADGCVFYNKTTKEGIALKENETVGFINDLTAGPDFKPRFSNDTTAWVSISALDMKLHLDSEKFKKQEVKFPEQKEELVQLNKSLKEDGNHFLMIARLK